MDWSFHSCLRSRLMSFVAVLWLKHEQFLREKFDIGTPKNTQKSIGKKRKFTLLLITLQPGFFQRSGGSGRDPTKGVGGTPRDPQKIMGQKMFQANQRPKKIPAFGVEHWYVLKIRRTPDENNIDDLIEPSKKGRFMLKPPWTNSKMAGKTPRYNMWVIFKTHLHTWFFATNQNIKFWNV